MWVETKDTFKTWSLLAWVKWKQFPQETSRNIIGAMMDLITAQYWPSIIVSSEKKPCFEGLVMQGLSKTLGLV